MGEILPTNFNKCFFRYDLIIGCAVYVTAEVYLWAILTLTAIYSEFKMIENRDLNLFKNFTTQNSSYYVTVFGEAPQGLSRGVILTQITINGILSIGFLLYCISSVILLIGISEKSISLFRPYHHLDTIFLYLSVAGIVLGILIQHKVMFRNCVIFAFKFYPSSCIYSLYRKLGGDPITFSSYTTLPAHQPSNTNPAIRLARSDTEFEESARKAMNEFKPKVSFSDELQQASVSEPNLSPQNIRQHETSILKPSFRKHLQLPINSSYP